MNGKANQPEEILKMPPGLAEAVVKKLKLWQERLIDLSFRNRLINFRETKSSTLKVREPMPSDLFRVLAQEEGRFFIASDGDQLSMSPSVQSSSNDIQCIGDSARTSRVLYRLRSRAHTELEERGVNVLFVALGFMNWFESPSSSVSMLSPIVLVPVQLERERSKARYVLTRIHEDVIVNPALVLKLKNDFGISLPEQADEADHEDLDHLLSRVRDLIPHTPSFRRWEIKTEAQIGLFSFQKLMMYKDLAANEERLKQHPIIGALCGFPACLPEIPDTVVSAGELDQKVPPERNFQILDADSSQQEAIQAATAGVSLVLQGPPGTGKSQTIANIIAECLALGKKVLFVSQKMAALEVVKRRLEGAGLSSFCLELHSHTKNKRTVIDELGECLATPVDELQNDTDFAFERLSERRRRLNAYVKALHTKHGQIKISAFEIYGQLARLATAPAAPFPIINPLETTHAQLDQIAQQLYELAMNGSILRYYGSHPWKDTTISAWTLQCRSQTEEGLRSLLRALDTTDSESAGLLPLLRAATENLDGHLRETFASSVFSLDLPKLSQLFSKEFKGIGKWLRYREYRKQRNLVMACLTTENSYDAARLPVDLNLARRLMEGWDLLARLSRQCDAPASTSVENLRLIAQWSSQAAAQASVCGCAIETISTLNDLSSTCSKLADTLKPKLLSLSQLFPGLPVALLDSLTTGELRARCRSLVDTIDDLRPCLEIRHSLTELNKLDVPGVEEIARDAAPEQLIYAFEKRFYEALLDSITQSEPDLAHFNSRAHDQVVEEFRRLDKDLVSTTHLRIVRSLSSARQAFLQRATATKALAVLQKEVQKQRRHKALRQLFAEAATIVQGLKPCLLMSPMSVATYLAPGTCQFDIVLFDEASQIMPEDAVGSVVRAPQIIVVGDSKQLPPTRFFAAIEGDDDSTDVEEDILLDSILDEVSAVGLVLKSLLWHYRSKDESLIAFSNRFLYSNRLVTFPSAGRHPWPVGVEYVFVKAAFYDRSRSRANRGEASRIAELVLDHFKRWPQRSLGVVAFSLPQSDAIDAAVEILRKNDPAFDEWCGRDDLEPFFVKNLENVQGDERDVMFFSVGYGPDERGQVSMNFGPLNQEGGHRRLNVAITRARENVKVVTCLDPAQIDLSKTAAQGVQLFKHYLEFAKNGTSALGSAADNGRDESGSQFEDEVFEALGKRGLVLRKQVGVSGYRIDIAVIDPRLPGRYALGIECDGATYHSFKTARDRDRLRQQVLEGLGWRIARIWSRDWVENREREIQRILSCVKASMNP